MEFPEMKDRIAHIIRAQNLTAAEFALRLGVQPSNVSHLLSGRNNPSLDFIVKLKETFPEYSFDWIILGRGPMTVSDYRPNPPLEDKPVEIMPSLPAVEPDEIPLIAQTASTKVPSSLPKETETDMKHLILVFQDNTFEVLKPR